MEKRRTYTSPKVKDRWNGNHYDNVTIRIPKDRKIDVQHYAESKGTSVNSMVNEYFRKELGMTEEEWKARTPEVEKESSAD